MQFKTIVLSTSFSLLATTALAQNTKQDIVDMLTDEGFQRIEISRTLFGNLRFEAEGPGIERELVLGKDGTVVRDRTEYDDEDDDDDDDDDEIDDEADEDDESDEENDEDDDDESDESDESDDDDSESDGEGDGESDSDSDSDSDGEGDSDSESDD